MDRLAVWAQEAEARQRRREAAWEAHTPQQATAEAAYRRAAERRRAGLGARAPVRVVGAGLDAPAAYAPLFMALRSIQARAFALHLRHGGAAIRM